MKQVIRNVAGISGIALISTLLLPLGVSAAVNGRSDKSADIEKATTITIESASESQSAKSEATSQPMIMANPCWIYLGGTWIYICNHDEVPVDKI